MTDKVFNASGNLTNGSDNFYDNLNTPAAGWVAIVICSICFGTNLIPVKKFKMGDGMAFQWLMCTGILFVGVVVQLAIGSAYRIPEFHPLAMLGGALWATGNSMTVVIIEAIGLALGILIWSIANMLMGFFSSRHGFGILLPKEPKNPTLNYIGVAIAVVSISLYAFIKPSTTEEDTETKEEEELERGTKTNKFAARFNCANLSISQLPSGIKKFIGFFMAILAGFFYGTNFMPVIYVQQQEGNSQAGLDYVFAHFLGIWLTSTIIFVIYSLIKKNSPWLPSNQAILPSLLSGILWAIAQSSWFVANAALGEPVTFPVVTTCPAVIATLVSVIIFKEITGKKNYIILGCAICVTFVGIVINALSMVDFS
nr:transmembrane protein 144 [Hymenolepis microstoma]